MSCVCSQSTLIFLLIHCPSLTSLAITSNPDICNETIAKVQNMIIKDTATNINIYDMTQISLFVNSVIPPP